MDGRERPDTSDEFDAEVSDTRPRASAATPPARSPLAPRLTPRRRLVRLGVIVSTGLVLAVVLASIPAVRDDAAGLASRFVAPPTPTLAPGSDQFYLLPNPPGVDVSLDGHALVRLPFPGDAHPLRLARGHHVFAWRSHIFPFPPADCTISVPLSAIDTCQFLFSQQLPPQDRSLAGRIIAMQISLFALSIPDQDQPTTALQDALGSIGTTALVQPGEHYYSAAPGATAGSAILATQPLRATLTYSVIFQSGYPDPCVVGQPFIPCRAPGEDCSQLCTLPGAPPTAANAPAVWIAGEAVTSTWSYTTLGGQVVADTSAMRSMSSSPCCASPGTAPHGTSRRSWAIPLACPPPTTWSAIPHGTGWSTTAGGLSC
jgi:hypothetical protein